MTSNIIPEKYQKTASIIFYIFYVLCSFLLILLNLFLLLELAEVTRFIPNFDVMKYTIVFCMSVSLISVISWFVQG